MLNIVSWFAIVYLKIEIGGNYNAKKTTLFSIQKTSRHNAGILQREPPKTPYFLCVCVCVCVQPLAHKPKQVATEVTICFSKFHRCKDSNFFANKKTFFKIFCVIKSKE